MSQRSEIRKLLARAEKAGCTVTRTGSGHWKIRTPTGESVIAGFSPKHPGAVTQTIRRLRKAGIEI